MSWTLIFIPIYLFIGILFADHYVYGIYSRFATTNSKRVVFWILWVEIILVYPLYILGRGIHQGIKEYKLNSYMKNKLNLSPSYVKQIGEKLLMEWLKIAEKKGHKMKPYKNKKSVWRCEKCGRFVSLSKEEKAEGMAIERNCISKDLK